MNRIDYIRTIAANQFWTQMARKPEDREPLDDEGWNNLFVSCLVNRAIPWERAMTLNDEMKRRTGYTSTLRLYTELSPAMIEWVMFDDDADYEPEGRNGALHRYRYMANYCHQAMTRIRDDWGGSAANLHIDEPTGGEFLRRVMSFKGLAQKCGGLYCRLAVLSHGAVLWDKYAGLDVSPDRHVMRVMSRLGLVSEDPTPQEAINKARELSPYAPVEWDGLFITGLDTECGTEQQTCSTCKFAIAGACSSRQ
ncbi:hypothetical protein EG827_12325 [bacterium]|nr:hypothetical protein [bacterium]